MLNKIIISAFLIFSVNLLAQNTDELFHSANRMYQNKEYDKAVKLYEEIVTEGYEGVSLYYNLGNAYYRSGKIGYAILFYEKALKLSPGDEDIQQNLRIANSKTIDKLPDFPDFFLFRIWENLLSVFSLSGWVYFSYIFFILLLISVTGYFLFKNLLYRKYSFYAGIIIAVIFTLSISIMLVKLNQDYNTRRGIIVQLVANVKTSPDENGDDTFVIHEGLKIKVEELIGSWMKIRLDDGKTGWVEEKNIEII